MRDGQPDGNGMGSQGPDQGYAIKIANGLKDELVLHKGEHASDAVSGCVAVALKRASQFMRGPTVHDVKAAFNLFGFFDKTASTGLIDARRELFSEVHHPHHYAERRAIADMVPADLLRLTPQQIESNVPDFQAVIMGVL